MAKLSFKIYYFRKKIPAKTAVTAGTGTGTKTSCPGRDPGRALVLYIMGEMRNIHIRIIVSSTHYIDTIANIKIVGCIPTVYYLYISDCKNIVSR